jgi:hypothetical protein
VLTAATGCAWSAERERDEINAPHATALKDMDRQYIRDNGVIERYLQGRLGPAEEQAFEEAYLADPALLEELKLAEHLREGVRQVGVADRSTVPTPQRHWLGFATSPRYAMAASLVAAVALVTSSALYVQNQGLRFAAGEPLVAASAMRVLPLVSVRGAGEANVIAAPSAGEWTVLLLDAGFTDYDRYRAALLRRSDGAELLRVDDLTPTYEGLLALGLPAHLLVPGEYEVRLEGGRRESPAPNTLDELSRTALTVTPQP